MSTPTPKPKTMTSAAQDALDDRRDGADWITPPEEERGFGRYLEIIWGGRWIIAIAMIAAVVAAVVYVETAQKTYQTSAALLITPVPPDATVSGLGLIEASSDPLRDVETGAGFVTTTTVADRVKAILHSQRTPASLLTSVSATPLAESDTVDVTATASTAAGAQALANAFANQTVVDRSAALQAQLDVLIPALSRQIAALTAASGGATRSALGGQLAELVQLRSGGNPNVRVQALADLPSSPISPRKAVTVVAALFGGLVLGVGIVFLLQLLDPRLRREQDLRDRFRVPILARVPRAPGTSRWRTTDAGPMTPGAVPPEAADAYATLRSVLVSAKRAGPDALSGRGRIVLVTGPSPFDGKSSTAINLAQALGASSRRVILIEGDTRRPSVGAAFGLKPERSLESVMYGESGVSEALTPMPGAPNEVQMLLSGRNGASPQPLMPSRFQAVLLAAREICEWVVVDAPPLIYAPDLLSGARYLDAVLLVVRLGNTNFKNLTETAEMLAHHNLRPTGFVVVGTSGRPDYY